MYVSTNMSNSVSCYTHSLGYCLSHVFYSISHSYSLRKWPGWNLWLLMRGSSRLNQCGRMFTPDSKISNVRVNSVVLHEGPEVKSAWLKVTATIHPSFKVHWRINKKSSTESHPPFMCLSSGQWFLLWNPPKGWNLGPEPYKLILTQILLLLAPGVALGAARQLSSGTGPKVQHKGGTKKKDNRKRKNEQKKKR